MASIMFTKVSKKVVWYMTFDMWKYSHIKLSRYSSYLVNIHHQCNEKIKKGILWNKTEKGWMIPRKDKTIILNISIKISRMSYSMGRRAPCWRTNTIRRPCRSQGQRYLGHCMWRYVVTFWWICRLQTTRF